MWCAPSLCLALPSQHLDVMPAIVYPALLPPPRVGWQAILRERAARSTIPGNPQTRRRTRDSIKDVSPADWTYTAAEMAIWWPWFNSTLIDGQLWFTAAGPGAGGLIDRVMRFRPGSARVQPQGPGIATVSADLEVRGGSAAPQVA